MVFRRGLDCLAGYLDGVLQVLYLSREEGLLIVQKRTGR